MAKGLNGRVYADIPPMPNLPFPASSFPTAAPSRTVPSRFDAMADVDMEGMVSLTHNSTASSPTFTLLYWSDVTKYWIQPYAAAACAQYGQVSWKVFTNSLIYIYASTALTGTGAIVVLGGVTIEGIQPTITAGV